MNALRRFLPPALTIFCGACISINEETFSKQSIDPHQRTIVAVYPSPGPWVVSESESKAESASKTLPLLSSLVQSYQDNRDNTAAADLAQYIPRWSPENLFAPHLMGALSSTAFPGRFIPAAETELDTATLRALNQAADTLDWQNRYFLTDSVQAQARDYSKILSLDDAVVYEANILPSVAMDDDGNMIPTLSVLSRLVRCRTGHSLWAHTDTAQNKEAARSMFEFKTLPQALVGRWISLMPTLSLQAANSLRVALGGIPVSTATAVSPPPKLAPPAAAATGSPLPTNPWPSISTAAIPSPRPAGY